MGMENAIANGMRAPVVEVAGERRIVWDMLNEHGYEVTTVLRLTGFCIIWVLEGEDAIWAKMPRTTVYRQIKQLRDAGIAIKDVDLQVPKGIRGMVARWWWRNMGAQTVAAAQSRQDKIRERREQNERE